MFMREDGDEHYEMAIGTLDDPAAIPALTEQVGVESRLPWLDSIAALPERRTGDDRSPQDLEKLRSLQHPDHDSETWP